MFAIMLLTRALFRHINDRLRCFAFIHPASEDLFFVRVNSLYLYSETNRNVRLSY